MNAGAVVNTDTVTRCTCGSRALLHQLFPVCSRAVHAVYLPVLRTAGAS